MGLFSFLSRKPLPTPSVHAPPQPASAAIPVQPHPRHPPLRREEVTDNRNRLYGYRFSLMQGRGEALLFSALLAERIAEFGARRLAVIPLTAAGAASPLHRQFAAPHTVFLVEARELDGDTGLALLQGLKQDGAMAGMRGLPAAAHQQALLEACDMLFLDLAEVDLPHFHAALDRLHATHPRLRIAVEGIASWEEQRMCLGWGADYCLGSFLSTPDSTDEEGALDQSRLTALRMLNLLRADAGLAELTDVAKQDPAITFQLLKWANAPINGQATTIGSLGQAIMLLGRNVLYRWLAVAIFKLGRGKERDAALMEVALRRARFLELVNPALGAAERDELFLVGLLSLFDVLFGVPMARLLEKLNLSVDTEDVLLRSRGKYGPYLMLALVLERGDRARAAQVAAGLGIDADDLGEVQAEAFAWTQESLLQQS